jgi:type I restriction enzyme S subunit
VSQSASTVGEMARNAFDDAPLPRGWRCARLGEVCTRISNGTSTTQNTEGKGLPVTRIETISSGKINAQKVGWIDSDIEDLEQYILRSGDILFSHINSVERLGNCALYDGTLPTLVHGMNLLRLEVNDSLAEPLFLLSYFRSEQARKFYDTNARRAIGQASLNIKDLSRLEIPLPPLPEQKRIAAILREQMAAVDQARTAAETQLKAAKDLPAAYLRAVFSSSEAHQWERKKLGDVCEIIGGNTLPESSAVDGERVYCLKVSDLESQFSDEHYISGGAFFTSLQKAGARVLNKGAVVFPKRGGAIATNKKRMLKVSAVLDPNLMGVQSIDESKVSSNYLFWWFKSWNLASLQSGNTVPQINQQDLAPLSIPVPSLQVQKRIESQLAEQAAKTASVRLALQGQLNTINQLPAALLRQAFTGKL